jgi:hypothetical protein
MKLSREISLAGSFCIVLASSPAAELRGTQFDDLESVRVNYVLKSKAFSATNGRRALAFIDTLEAAPGPLPKERFLVSLLQIAAFAQNAHDSLRFAAGAWRPENKLPFRIIWFPDAMLIARAAPEQSELVGASVERIEGLSTDPLLERLHKLCGGPDRYLRWNTLWILENAGLLNALGLAQNPDKLRFRLLLRDGDYVDCEIAFVPQTSMPERLSAVRLWSAELTSDEAKHRWSTATSAAGDPFYLQKADEFFRIAPMPEIDGIYVQFRANSTADAAGHEILPFVKNVRDQVKKMRPKNLVLDLRFDIGGDIDQTRDLARSLAANVRDRIYVITSRYTFSAGIVMAAAMKHDGGSRVTIAGEEVGDDLQWWSEGKDACLPNSHYCLRATTGLWDLVKGCAQEPDCYGDRLDARVDSLDPRLQAPLTAQMWLSGRDAAMEAIKADLAPRTSTK